MSPWPKIAYHVPADAAICPISWEVLGEDRVSTPKYDWRGLARPGLPGLLWQTTLSGRGRIDIGSRKGIALDPGSSFLAYLPSDHRYYFNPADPPWTFRFVIWRGPALETFFRSCLRQECYVFKAPVDDFCARRIGTLIDMYLDGESSPWQNAIDAMQLLIPTLRAAQRIDLLGGEQPQLSSRQLIEPVERDPRLPVEKQGWAEAHGLSRYQLYRRVKAQTGLSPKDLRNRHRLREAIRYLRKPRIAIADVASLAGFRSQNYFARFFKRHTGYSPSEWRGLFASGD